MIIYVLEVELGHESFPHSAWSTRALADAAASEVEKHSDVTGTEVVEIVLDAPGDL